MAELLTVVFALGLPIWLVAEELLTRMPAPAKAERPVQARQPAPDPLAVSRTARTA
jgi:hypothetical protein